MQIRMITTNTLKTYMANKNLSTKIDYIGDGLIGSAIKNQGILSKNSIIIAKGVSNSQESKNDEFERELSLIKDCYYSNGPDVKYILLSSCSVVHTNSLYVSHKINIENYVKKNFERYMIYRLPQVVGVTDNSTIVSHLVKKIFSEEAVEIQEHAMRELIDVDDIPRIIYACEQSNIKTNSIINVSHGMMISIYDLVMKISKLMNQIPIYKLIDSGQNYELKKDETLKMVLGKNDIFFKRNYTINILSKYVPLIAAQYRMEEMI